jgi:hypothetical protein
MNEPLIGDGWSTLFLHLRAASATMRQAVPPLPVLRQAGRAAHFGQAR